MAATALNRSKIEMEKRVPDGENTATFLEVTCLPRIFRWVYTKILSKQDFGKLVVNVVNSKRAMTLFAEIEI